jgi:CRP-like cAMP-binding protein
VETGKKAGVDAEAKAGVLGEKGLTGEQLRALAALAEARTFDANESVFREGDVGESLYVVLDGKVRIQKHIPGVGDEALAILERGDFFGEMAIVDRAPRSASAVAHDPDTTVLRFGRKHVDRLLEEDVEAGRAFLEVLCRILSRRLREINDRIVQWRYMSGGF